jgi:hypothetical protein
MCSGEGGTEIARRGLEVFMPVRISKGWTLVVVGALSVCACSKAEEAVQPEPVASELAATVSAPPPPPKISRNITASCVVGARASSEHPRHPAIHAFDEKPSTAWNENADGDGTGEWVEVHLKPGTVVHYVEAGGGWSAMSNPGRVDLWEHNNSFRQMKVSWDSGQKEVSFQRATDRGKKKRVDIDAETKSIRFTAQEIDRGRFNDLCLDDVLIYGDCPAGDVPVAVPEVASGTKCPPTRDEACHADVFVQLAVPRPTTPLTYDYPLTQKLLRGNPEFRGTRIVETTRKGRRTMGAIVRNRCVADELIRVADEAMKSNPQASCEPITVDRTVFVVD